MEPKMDSWGTALVIDPNKGLGDKNGMFWPISPFNFTNSLMISVFLAGKNTATEFVTDFSLRQDHDDRERVLVTPLIFLHKNIRFK